MLKHSTTRDQFKLIGLEENLVVSYKAQQSTFVKSPHVETMNYARNARVTSLKELDYCLSESSKTIN